MRKRWTCLIAGLAALGLVFLILAVTVFRGGLGNLFAQPIGVLLIYEVEKAASDEPLGQVDMEKLVAAINRRVNPQSRPRGRVRALDNGQIEVAVFGNDPEIMQRIEYSLKHSGTLEFRILANQRDHPALIDRATQQEDRGLLDDDGTLLAWWVPVARGSEDNFSNVEIVTRPSTSGDESEILVVNDPFNVTGNYLVRASPGIDA